MRDTEDLKFFIRKSHTAKHQTVTTKGLNGVDAHTAHKFFYFVPPSVHQIHKPLASHIGIEALYKLGTLGCDTPVAFTALTGTAKMAAESKQSRCCDTESDRKSVV